MTQGKPVAKKKSGRFSTRSGRATVTGNQSTDDPQFGQPAPSPDPTGFPIPVTDTGDDMDYGYLRIVVDTGNLRIEYHPASDGTGAKTPNDTVTVNLKTRALI